MNPYGIAPRPTYPLPLWHTWNTEIQRAAAEYADHPIAGCREPGCFDLSLTDNGWCPEHVDPAYCIQCQRRKREPDRRICTACHLKRTRTAKASARRLRGAA